jgi:hypothetical protein
MAVLAAVLANLLNNLPATLMLLPLTAHNPGLVLAVLLGANVGPNLTYAGSLATLLWRQILHRRGRAAGARGVLPAGCADRAGLPGGGRRRPVAEFPDRAVAGRRGFVSGHPACQTCRVGPSQFHQQ